MKLRNIWKYVIAFLVPVIMVMTLNGCLDNDSWYVLAEGRQIAEQGIYYTDELSIHDDFAVVVQNYGFAVIFWWIYAILGPVGLYLGMLMLLLVVLWLLYKICMLISEKNVNLSLILTMATGMLLALDFAVTRAQMVDYVVILALIYVLELYVKTGKGKYLGWVPLLSLVEINLHASSWWMLFAVMATYLIDAIRRPKLHLQGYKMGSLWVALVISLLMGAVNPYGMEMVAFIFKSYGGVVNLDLVSELEAFRPLRGWGVVYFLALTATITLYIFGKSKNLRTRYLLMFFGFLMIGLNTVKGMSEVILVMLFPLARVYKDWQAPKLLDSEKIRRMAISWVGVLAMGSAVVLAVMMPMWLGAAPNRVVVEAVDAIDMEIAGREKRDLKIYTDYNNGGYVEFRGYRGYLDPRAEVFLKVNNKKEDLLQEWVDLRDGKIKKEDFLAKYDFDYLMVNKNDSLYDEVGEEYEVIYAGEDDDLGYKVYKKVENRGEM